MYTYNELAIYFKPSKEFFEWVSVQGFTKDHQKHITSYYKRHYANKRFNHPIELQKYLINQNKGINTIINTGRVYLRYCEEYNLFDLTSIIKYRKVLKIKKSKQDYFVPSNEEVTRNYKQIKNNPTLELVYLVLATSGIRYCECLSFLKGYELSKFTIHENFVSYNVSELRNTKNINNIYLPMFVYKKLFKISNTYDSIRTRYNEKEVLFSLKYLRKWHYNFLLYNNVPESVSDFMQGRVSKGISANHYLSRSQQASFWYEKIVEKLNEIFFTQKVI